MGIRDTIQFNEAAYRKKIKSITLNTLFRKHHAKVREEVRLAGKLVLSIIALPSTAGIALITKGGSLGYDCRQLSVEHQKKRIIEEELKARGQNQKLKRRVRDVAGGVGLALISGLFEVALIPCIIDLLGVLCDLRPDFEALTFTRSLDNAPTCMLDALNRTSNWVMQYIADVLLEKIVKKRTNHGY